MTDVFPVTTSYLQFSKFNLQEYYTRETFVLLRKKAIHLHPTHWAIALHIP